GTHYAADQDLFDASRETDGVTSDDAPGADEWMQLTCANGNSGWLLLRDVADHPGYDQPNIIEYGKAADI
ncbi:MAG: hypothetical protein AAGD23_09915, partial [Pseudomonadota bacterium]